MANGDGAALAAVRQRVTPHQGFEAEPREAMRRVEQYYHRLMRLNGRRGSMDDR